MLGFSLYKMSTVKIMNEMKLITIHHLILKESILLIHKILFNNCPESIANMITFSINEH